MPGVITFPSDFDFLNKAVRYGPHDRWHLPNTEGFRAWFVDPAALSGGTGTRRTSPLQTIAAALVLATAGDVIYVLPGDHDVNVAGRLAVNAARLTLIGFGDSTIVRNTNAGATGVLELVGIDVRLIGVHIFGNAGGPAIAVTGAGDKGTLVRDVFVEGGSSGLLINGPSNCVVEDCWFESLSADGVVVQAGNNHVVRGNRILGFASGGAGFGIRLQDAANMVHDNLIQGGGNGTGIREESGNNLIARNVVRAAGATTPWEDTSIALPASSWEDNVGGVRTGTFAYPPAGGEQTVLDDVTPGKSGLVRFTIDMTNVAGGVTVTLRLYEKIDGTNYREVAEVVSAAAGAGITMPVATAHVIGRRRTLRATIAFSAAPAAPVNVPFVLAEAV